MRRVVISLVGGAALGVAALAVAQPERKADEQGDVKIDMQQVDHFVASWPAKPRAVAYMMIRKYGMPDDAGATKLVWNNTGPWKRTVVHREEVQHNFPMPHKDVLTQVIDFRVPADRFDELATFDGSIKADRTKGELSASCDSEEANFLAINLAAEIAQGKRTADQARTEMGRHLVAVMTSDTPPAFATGLRFGKMEQQGGDPDRATLSGGFKAGVTEGRDIDAASTLALLIAENHHEVHLGKFAAENTASSDIKGYAQHLKSDHAKALGRVLKLGPQLRMEPTINSLVQEREQKAHDHLAQLARQKGAAFDRMFLDLSVSEHAETLKLIDSQLLPAAKNAQLKQELQSTRDMIDRHLKEGRELQRKHKTAMR